MDKKILASLLMIGIVAAVLGGATYAVFSDTEKSVDNTMTAGTIDFSVDGENPWASTTWSEGLDDLKPCVVRYGEFNITNVGTNPMKLWKKLTITNQTGGVLTEPECVECGGVYNDTTDECEGSYIERCNLAAYTLYDMTITIDGGDPVVLISDDQQVRLDNIGGVWIALGEVPLEPESTMIVNQSYHLSSWTGAADPTVTNWAQGDILTFDVELYGEQLTGTGPVPDDVGPDPNIMTLQFENKDAGWEPITDDGISGEMTYNAEGPDFVFDFTGVAPDAGAGYSLIYYADPWTGHFVKVLGFDTSDDSGNVTVAGTINIGDLPASGDSNYPIGAKIELVLTSDLNAEQNAMVGYHQASYLYEMNLIQYEDTDD